MLTLRTTHPCCGGRVRLTAVPGVPRERYVRRCGGCGWIWDVERTTIRETLEGYRLDRLDWDPGTSRKGKTDVQAEAAVRE